MVGLSAVCRAGALVDQLFAGDRSGGALDSIIANPGIPNGNAMDMGRQMHQKFVVWNHQGAQIKIVVVDAGQDAEVDIFTSLARDAWKFDPVR